VCSSKAISDRPVADTKPETDAAASGNRSDECIPLAIQLTQALKTHWGYDRFRALQLETLEAIFNRKDSITLLPTGGGKSLCYQLPMALKPGETALIISPLIALMQDQVTQAQEKGFQAAMLTSAQSVEDRKAIFARYRAGEVQLLYVSPERAIRPAFLEALKEHGTLAYIAVDEAHCISQWGHQFRPEYQQLGLLRDAFPGVAIHAFTATAPRPVKDDIALSLQLQQPQVLNASMYRANLAFRVEERASRKAVFYEEQLLPYVLNRKAQCGLIYCLSRQQVEDISTLLQVNGVPARGYHAGMAASLRQKNQDAFMAGEINVMVATLAFGMGIDRSDIRYVVHTHAPKALEQYVQEAGRGGRDGNPSDCVLFSSSRDVYTWEKMLKQEGLEGESFQHALQRLWHLQQYIESHECRHRVILEYFGQRLRGNYRCTGCDICQTHPAPYAEATTLAQHAFSIIWRLNHRATFEHLLGVLIGEASLLPIGDREEAMQLPSYGMFNRTDKATIANVLMQLERYHFLMAHENAAGYPVLGLTREAMNWLRAMKAQEGGPPGPNCAVLPPIMQGLAVPVLTSVAPVKAPVILPNARPKPTRKKRKSPLRSYGAGNPPD
jgi:ATP-dependent DNA helicase RecQ